VPGVATPLVACLFAALAINMQALSVLLLTRESSGSFAQAGTVAAALGLGSAAGLVVQGNLLDRYGHTLVLVPGGAVCCGSLVLLTLATSASAPLTVVALVAATAGVSVPAVPSAMRVLSPALIAEPGLRTSAYALLAIQLQVSTVLGPLIVSGVLLIADARAAVLGTGLLAVGAAVGFAATRASRRWRPAGPARRWPLHGAASPGLRTLLGTGLGAGAVGGLIAVGVPAVAVAHGTASLAGVLLAVSAVGGIIGGFGYGARGGRLEISLGSRSWRPPLWTQLVLAQTGETVAAIGLWVGVLTVVLLHPIALAPLMLIGGIFGAPNMIISSTLLDTVARKGALTESYTSLIAAMLLGSAVGNYTAGTISELAGEPSVFGVAALTVGSVAAWTYTRRRTL
jgi:hypothetical protein